MVTGDKNTQVKEFSELEELSGKLDTNPDKGLMRSVIEADEETIDDGKLASDAVNQGLESFTFTASMVFEKLVQNYSLAQNIFGESIIRKLTGFEPNTVQKNIKLPEFQRELLTKISEKIEKLKESKILDKEGVLTERAVDLAALVMYTEELDKITPKGITGEKVHKKPHPYGIKDEIGPFKKERYRDIALRRSIRKAAIRGHTQIQTEDLMSFRRKSKGRRYIIYALDASASMKGEKLEKSKKAGIALAYKAIEEKDLAGLVAFGTEIKTAIAPTDNFPMLLREITRTKAATQTDIANTIKEATNLFPKQAKTKHLILLTDSMPTKGEKPEADSVAQAAEAAAQNVTISLIGVKLEKKGAEIAQKIVEAGKGRLFIVDDLKDVDKIVLMDYYET